MFLFRPNNLPHSPPDTRLLPQVALVASTYHGWIIIETKRISEIDRLCASPCSCLPPPVSEAEGKEARFNYEAFISLLYVDVLIVLSAI